MKKQVTADQVEKAIREYIAEQQAAIGSATQRSRFYEFKVRAEIRDLAKTSLELFKTGASFEEALSGIQKAKSDLVWAQRRYCAGSVKARFEPLLQRLPHIDEDVMKKLEKRVAQFAKVAEVVGKGSGDLDKASQEFWDLRDTINRAPEEQEAREREREELKRLGKLKTKQQRFDAEVQASRERNRLNRQKEAEQRADLVNQLEAML